MSPTAIASFRMRHSLFLDSKKGRSSICLAAKTAAMSPVRTAGVILMDSKQLVWTKHRVVIDWREVGAIGCH